MLIYTILTGGSIDVGRIIYGQIYSVVMSTSTSGFCFLSLITFLCQQVGCVCPRDLELFLIKSAIKHSSLFGHPRVAFRHREHEVEIEDEEEGPDDTVNVDDLSTWMANLAVRQDDMHDAMDRHFDALEGRTQRFKGWVASKLQGMASHSGMPPFVQPPWPPVTPSD